MEVHHHPNVEKKGFKEYLLEGLMIFLAVMMGYLAESLRESINNKEKGKEYIISLINNLEEDTTNLNYTINDNTTKLKGLDSLLLLSFETLDSPANKQLLYNFSGSYISFYSRFASNDATMMQLKNSGGLQYIKQAHVADSIATYDQRMTAIYASETPYAKSNNDAIDAMSELLIFKIKRDTGYYKNGHYTGKALPLLTHDPQKINVFFNKVSLERGWTQNYITNLQEMQPVTIRLIALLKKEYDIN